MTGDVVETRVIFRAAELPGDIERVRAFAGGDTAALSAIDRHLGRPRYRPALTRLAEQAGELVGYILLAHRRLRLSLATIETGTIEAIAGDATPAQIGYRDVLMGDCLRVLVEEGLPLITARAPADDLAALGFAPYRFDGAVELDAATAAPAPSLRPASEDDLEDLAALYQVSYASLPLAEVRAAPDWRAWLGEAEAALALEDARGRVIGYAAAVLAGYAARLEIAEAAAADAGAARVLCAGLLAWARQRGFDGVRFALAPWHPVARAGLYAGGQPRLAASPPAGAELAGVVDLPALLEALAPEFERRLALSRYAGWSGNLRIEIETERITLALDAGRPSVIDGSRPADVRLRRVALPALAQLCLGYRPVADLRATGELDYDDSALSLLDALFPTLMAT
jgi:hypothetical protein